MKIRQGFVSNSSSSSFIIKVDRTEDGYIKVKPSSFGEVISSEADARKYIKEWSGKDKWEDLEDYELDKYNEYMKIIESGKTFILGCVEQGAEEDIEGFFKDLDFEWENL